MDCFLTGKRYFLVLTIKSIDTCCANSRPSSRWRGRHLHRRGPAGADASQPSAPRICWLDAWPRAELFDRARQSAELDARWREMLLAGRGRMAMAERMADQAGSTRGAACCGRAPSPRCSRICWCARWRDFRAGYPDVGYAWPGVSLDLLAKVDGRRDRRLCGDDPPALRALPPELNWQAAGAASLWCWPCRATRRSSPGRELLATQPFIRYDRALPSAGGLVDGQLKNSASPCARR